MRNNPLKALWQNDHLVLNAWLTIPSPWTAEVMAHSGYHSLTIDMQHGLMDYQTALAMLQAISTTPVAPLVRVPWNDPAMIMRLLDAGVYGVVCPMVNTRAEAEVFVRACRYPPLGDRSFGPIRANLYAGNDYFAKANQTILALAMIETSEALENVEEIAATPGLDGLYIGAVDLSISLGFSEKVDFTLTPIKKALETIVNAAYRYNLVAGIHAQSLELIPQFKTWGFQMITPVNDTVLLRSAAHNSLEKINKCLT
jgi:4-hydroxy-2-oxoheptanedioate aldolase